MIISPQNSKKLPDSDADLQRTISKSYIADIGTDAHSTSRSVHHVTGVGIPSVTEFGTLIIV